MADLDALKNLGLVQIGEPPSSDVQTVVVVGAARGGTSILSGTLAELGVFMGEQACAPVFEDVRLARAIEQTDWNDVRSIVAEYDDKYSAWGFKRPSAVPHLTTLHLLLRNPVYLFVFRDALAIANRNAISMRAELLPSMRSALSAYGEMLGFIERAAPTGLLMSTEKLLARKDMFVDRLIEYLGLQSNVTPEQRERAKAFIQLDPETYLERSRLEFVGHVDRVTSELVAGWAWIKGQAKPAELRVRLKGKVVGHIIANLPRKDVKRRGVHPTGRCGFRFPFPDGHKPGSGDEVAVEFQLGGDHLTNSPRTVD